MVAVVVVVVVVVTAAGPTAASSFSSCTMRAMWPAPVLLLLLHGDRTLERLELEHAALGTLPSWWLWASCWM